MMNFYPRPLRGGRRTVAAVYRTLYEFLSTPSARRATAQVQRGGPRRPISIHALCEEGDAGAVYSATTTAYFYPRPLRGGRPFNKIHKTNLRYISIHALCEEGDRVSGKFRSNATDFYPRPLRGGRPAREESQPKTNSFLSTPSARRATRQGRWRRCRNNISIHALCEEGDPCSTSKQGSPMKFLSTPSARRATP